MYTYICGIGGSCLKTQSPRNPVVMRKRSFAAAAMKEDGGVMPEEAGFPSKRSRTKAKATTTTVEEVVVQKVSQKTCRELQGRKDII